MRHLGLLMVHHRRRPTAAAATAIGVLVLMAGCDDSPIAGPNADPSGPTTLKSIALSPRGFPADFSALPGFFGEAGSLERGAVLWNGAWRDDVMDGSDAGTPPAAATVVAGQSETYGYAPVLVFGWGPPDDPHIGVPANPIDAWSNEPAVELYIETVRLFAAEYEPAMIFLGNESDGYFQADPEDYGRWIGVYERAYDAIEDASPGTLVGPVFQYERMAGIGTLAGMDTPGWGAVELHDLDKVDVVGLTIYPFFAHATPADIPEGYLDPLVSRIGSVPIAITESGWPAEAAPGFEPPWEVSEAHQVTFAERMDDWVAERDIRLVTWLYLHPPVEDAGLSDLEWNIFGSISLRRSDGSRRPVYGLWEDPQMLGGR